MLSEQDKSITEHPGTEPSGMESTRAQVLETSTEEAKPVAALTAEPPSETSEAAATELGLALSDTAIATVSDAALGEASITEAATGASPASVEPTGTGEAVEAFDDQLIDQYAVPQTASPDGELIEGQVVAITDLGVVVDLGAKNEGLIPAQEFVGSEGGIRLLPGQTVEVQRLDERKEGYVLLSYQRARRRRAWENIEKAYREHTDLTGQVVDRIKGGLVVDIGIRAFLPASQVDLRPTHDLEAWKDKEITCRVLKLNRKRGNVVVSRRVILDEELQALRQKLLDSLVEGAVVTGKVKNITDYGVFVDLGGLDGLLHITDLSWGRLKHPSEAVAPEQEIEVKVLKFDREKMRGSLGRKQLLPDPWAGVAERVRTLLACGLLLKVEEGFAGLTQVSDIGGPGGVKNPAEVFKKGDMVQARVLKIDAPNRRVSLGLKQVNDIWANWFAEHKLNDVVRGRVSRMTNFGAFVELAQGIEGLCHISEIEDRKKKGEKDPQVRSGKAGGALEPGQEYDFKIVKLQPEQHKIGLSYRAAIKQAERREMEDYRSAKSSPTATLGDVFYSKRGPA